MRIGRFPGVRRLAASTVMVIMVVVAANAATAQPAHAVGLLTIAHSGLPDPYDYGEEVPAQATDWNGTFAALKAYGVTSFFPHTDSIAEFVTTPWTGCNYNSAAYTALRAQGMKLIVPGFLLYPPGWLTQRTDIWNLWFDPWGSATAETPPAMPPVPAAGSTSDPLQQLIACVGGASNIYAVSNYDEPAFAFDEYDASHRIPAPNGIEEVKKLYERVKAISSTTKVMMVHAPIPRTLPTPDPAPPAAPAPCINPPAAGTATDPWSFVTPAEWISDYLARVTNFSVWTDWVGFDLYSVPDGEISRIITDPYRGGLEVQSYNHTVYDYVQWLQVNIAKPRFLASQGFSMARNTEVLLDWCLSVGAQRAPTWQELSNMNYQAYDRGAFLVLYWGIHLLQTSDVQPSGLYESLLYVSSIWGT